MEDGLKAKFFRDGIRSEIFQAQIALEEQTYNSWISKMLSIDLSKSDVQLEYAKIRGALEVLQSIKSTRERLAEIPRSRDQNS